MMFWSKKKSPHKSATDQAHLDEIIEHKVAVDIAVEQNQNSNAKLKKLFDDNHFTVKIALAMGAKQNTRGIISHGH
jgi:hypothetical protein